MLSPSAEAGGKEGRRIPARGRRRNTPLPRASVTAAAPAFVPPPLPAGASARGEPFPSPPTPPCPSGEGEAEREASSASGPLSFQAHARARAPPRSLPLPLGWRCAWARRWRRDPAAGRGAAPGGQHRRRCPSGFSAAARPAFALGARSEDIGGASAGHGHLGAAGAVARGGSRPAARPGQGSRLWPWRWARW